MMALHDSSGTPAVTPPVKLVSDTSAQWRRAILATVVVSRLRRPQTLTRSAQSQQGLGEPEQVDPGHTSLNENGSLRENNDDEEANRVDLNALDRTLKDENPEVDIVKLVRDELVKQLDAYGLVLVLLAGITFVAILQPPGSFDNGKLQGSLLVSFFMLLATLSFFIACTGLGAVMVGCAQLFRPFFHTKLAKYTTVSESCTTETPDQGFTNCLPVCWKIDSNYVAIDNVNLLAALCIENVYRIRRVRIYLGVSLVFCIAAYICGAIAVMTNDRRRYMLIGAMVVGGAVVLCEICMTLLISPVAGRDRSFRRQEGGFRMGCTCSP